LSFIAPPLGVQDLLDYNGAMNMNAIPPIQEFEIIDSSVVAGRFIHPECPSTLDSIDRVIGMMDTYGINECLAVPAAARTKHPRKSGNRELMETVSDHARVHPVYVINPDYPGADDGTASDALSDKAAAVQLPFGFIRPVPEIWESALALLEKHRIPAFCCFGTDSVFGAPAPSDITGLYEMTRKYPDLPFVFSNVMGGLGIPPELFHLILKRENAFLDITGILTFWREAVKKAGAGKVLFATGAPYVEPGILLYNVQYEPGLSAADKRRIYCGNIRKLMENRI
jgi:predicted TIM-barrel fold metal-dependent hydrolase